MTEASGGRHQTGSVRATPLTLDIIRRDELEFDVDGVRLVGEGHEACRLLEVMGRLLPHKGRDKHPLTDPSPSKEEKGETGGGKEGRRSVSTCEFPCKGGGEDVASTM